MEIRFLIFLFRSQMVNFFVRMYPPAKLGKGVDITKSRLPDYISVNTDPSRFGCKIWGRPSLPISSINIGTFTASTMTALGSIS